MWRVFSLFLGFLVELWLLSLWERILGARATEPWRARVRHRQAVRFRNRAVELGGLLIKLGQFLSARVDLLPREYTEVLSTLQDQVPPAPWAEVEGILAELPVSWREVFAELETEPVAAASFGQVHRARLATGETVAVKIQRPGIEEMVEADLRATAWFLVVLDRFTRVASNMDIWAVFEEVSATTRAELDYIQERENLERLRRNLSSLEGVRIPRVYPELSTRRVMVMEYVEGVRVTDHEALARAGVSREQTARRLVQAYMKMVLEDGFFHADPHPGNLLVDAEGNLVLLDFGMVGRITPAQMAELRALFVAVAQRREGEIVRAFHRLGFLRPGADLGAVRRAVGLLLDRFYTTDVRELYRIDAKALAAELQELIRKQPFQVPANVAFLGRALSILVGVSTGLDPGLNLVQMFEPYARRLVLSGGESSLAGEILSRLRTGVLSLLQLPELAAEALQRRREDRWTEEVVAALRAQTAALRATARAAVALPLLVGAAVLAADRHPGWAAVFGVGAAVMYLGLWLRG